jgi:hypothetical protein
LQILQESEPTHEGFCGVPQVVAQERDSIQKMMNKLEFVNIMSAKFSSH